jgi:DNA-binding response OmpR family regulator
MPLMPEHGKIMAVDDESDILIIVRRHLELWGFSIDTFTNPLHALKEFKARPDAYSVVLLDVRMRKMSGLELAKMMRQTKPDVKIVLMTAFEVFAEDLKISLPNINSDDILRKPFSVTQVCEAVKRQLHTA